MGFGCSVFATACPAADVSDHDAGGAAKDAKRVAQAAKQAAQLAKKQRAQKKANVPQDVVLPAPKRTAADDLKLVNLKALRMAIEDLVATFGKRYPRGAQYLKQLDALIEKSTRSKRRSIRKPIGRPGASTRSYQRSSRPIAVCGKRRCSPTP